MASTDQVIIAGAGPAGCVAALYLAQQGIGVTLLESEPTLPLDLRASTFHPPTLDMLEPLGVTEKLVEMGLVAPAYQFRDRRSGEAATFDLGLLKDETAHPYRLQVEQYKMTQVICDMLQDYPHAELRFSSRVVGFRQTDSGVRVLAFGDGEEQILEGRYLLGADGADSRVRQNLAVIYEGFTYPEKFLVVSTTVDFQEHWDNLCYVNYVSDPEEWCVLLRTPKLWRVLFPTDPADSDDLVLSDDFIQNHLQGLIPLDEEYPVIHRTLYRVHQRVADTYRVGRVLLMGDAAHINNPLGGMGMNGGVHDAFNLAEKLTSIMVEGASEDLLDRYDRQRRSLAVKFVQEHTIRNRELIKPGDENTQAKRQAEFQKLANDPVAAKDFLMRTSMIQMLRDTELVR